MDVAEKKCQVKSLVENADINPTDVNLRTLPITKHEDDVNVLHILQQFNDKSLNNKIEPYKFKELVKIATDMHFEGDPTAYLNSHAITRIPWSNQRKIDKYCKKSIPFIVENCPLVQHSIDVWTMQVLEEKFEETDCTVFESDTEHFLYWNAEKEKNLYDLPFKQPNITSNMTFKQFRSEAKKRLDQLVSKVKINGTNPPAKKPKWMYLQNSFNDLPSFVSDFRNWDWNWIIEQSKKFGWGLPDNNLLLIGMKGVKTPVHFDERENFFCQVRGHKRVCLYPPADYDRMYPYPYGHQCDRQSMVNIDNPNFEHFPEFRKCRRLTTVVGPGDALHIPAYWWHYFENLDQFAMSITFWSKQKSLQESPSFPLSVIQLVAARRNVEDIVLKKFSHIKNGKKKIRTILREVKKKDSPLGNELRYLVGLLLPKRPHLMGWFIENLVIGRYDRPIEWYNNPIMMQSSDF